MTRIAVDLGRARADAPALLVLLATLALAMFA